MADYANGFVHELLQICLDTQESLGVTLQPIVRHRIEVEKEKEKEGRAGAASRSRDEEQQNTGRFWIQEVAKQALKAGAQQGDVIFGVNGALVDGSPLVPIQTAIAAKDTGGSTVLQLSLLRGCVDKIRGTPLPTGDLISTSFSVSESLGLTLRPVKDKRGQRCSVVVNLVAGAQGEKLGAQTGDVILAVGGHVQHDEAMPQIKASLKEAKANGQPSIVIVFLRTKKQEPQEQAKEKKKLDVGEAFKKSVFGNIFKKKEPGSNNGANPEKKNMFGDLFKKKEPKKDAGGGVANSPANAEKKNVFGDLFKKKEPKKEPQKEPKGLGESGTDSAEVAELKLELEKLAKERDDAVEQLSAERKRHTQTVQQLVALRASRAKGPGPDGDGATAPTAAQQAQNFKREQSIRDTQWIEAVKRLLATVKQDAAAVQELDALAAEAARCSQELTEAASLLATTSAD